MKVIFGVQVFCIIQMGCSSSYVVSSAPYSDPSFSTFNTDAEGRRGTIVFQDGRKMGAHRVMTDPDSTSFVNTITGARTVVPNHEIDKIIFTSSGLGFLEGAGIGLLAGGLGGLAAAAIIVGRGAGEEGLAYVFLPLFGGGGGLLLGGIIGGSLGHSYEYKFVREPTAR
jgi:hypothetical protein